MALPVLVGLQEVASEPTFSIRNRFWMRTAALLLSALPVGMPVYVTDGSE
jgi:hypothetical protein